MQSNCKARLRAAENGLVIRAGTELCRPLGVLRWHGLHAYEAVSKLVFWALPVDLRRSCASPAAVTTLMRLCRRPPARSSNRPVIIGSGAAAQPQDRWRPAGKAELFRTSSGIAEELQSIIQQTFDTASYAWSLTLTPAIGLSTCGEVKWNRDQRVCLAGLRRFLRAMGFKKARSAPKRALDFPVGRYSTLTHGAQLCRPQTGWVSGGF